MCGTEQPHDGAEPSAEMTPGRQQGAERFLGYSSVSSQRESLLSVITCRHFSSTHRGDAPSRAPSKVASQWAGEAARGGAGHGAKLSLVCLGWWQCRVLLGSPRLLVAPILCGEHSAISPGSLQAGSWCQSQ